MTTFSDGSTTNRETPSPEAADVKLRQTNAKMILGAAGVAAVAGLISMANGGAAGVAALVLAVILGGMGWRRQSGHRTVPAPNRRQTSSDDCSVTDADVEKARSLNTADLDIEDICRLTRGGYSWWAPADKAAFRADLSRRLRG